LYPIRQVARRAACDINLARQDSTDYPHAGSRHGHRRGLTRRLTKQQVIRRVPRRASRLLLLGLGGIRANPEREAAASLSSDS
jgi:hypothetical protein